MWALPYWIGVPKKVGALVRIGPDFICGQKYGVEWKWSGSGKKPVRNQFDNSQSCLELRKPRRRRLVPTMTL